MACSATMLLMHLLYVLTVFDTSDGTAAPYSHDESQYFEPAEGTAYEHLMTEQKIIQMLLTSEDDREKYDWRVRPKGQQKRNSNDSPVMVMVNLYLRTISKVDDVNMEYSLHFTFREEWIDDRLIFNSPTLQHIVLAPGQQIWMPDTFFQNEKDGKKHDIDTPNVLLRIYNGTGKILYSVRMTLTLSCPMQLQNYPMDVQICYVDYASYAYTTRDIEYIWKPAKPIQIKKGLKESLPSFVLSDVTTGNCTSVTNTGTYSCLRTILKLKREFSYYLLQLYIPSLMLVAVSWVSFWLDKDSVPARVTLGVTTLLTMTTQASGINAKLPPVSYTKAIDVWIGVCLAFIFGALLEFALVNWAARKDMMEDNKKRRLNQQKQTAVSMMTPLIYQNAKQRFPVTTAALISADSSDFNVTLNDDYRAPVCYSGTPTVPQGFLQRTRSGVVDDSEGGFPSANENAPTLQREFRRREGRWHRLWKVKYKQKSKRIDVLSRILFPISFLVFNLGYWIKYIGPYLAVGEHNTDKIT